MQNSAIFFILLALLSPCQQSASWIHTSAKLSTTSPHLPYEQVVYTTESPLHVTIKTKKTKAPEPFHSTYSIIQRKYTFFCPQTSKSVLIIICL